MGRRKKSTPTRVAAILRALRLCNTRANAAHQAGISRDTFYEWMKKPTFSDAVREAEAEAESKLVAMVVRGSIRSWQAAAWLLKNRSPNDWQRTPEIDEDEAPETVTIVFKQRDPMAARPVIEIEGGGPGGT